LDVEFVAKNPISMHFAFCDKRRSKRTNQSTAKPTNRRSDYPVRWAEHIQRADTVSHRRTRKWLNFHHSIQYNPFISGTCPL